MSLSDHSFWGDESLVSRKSSDLDQTTHIYAQIYLLPRLVISCFSRVRFSHTNIQTFACFSFALNTALVISLLRNFIITVATLSCLSDGLLFMPSLRTLIIPNSAIFTRSIFSRITLRIVLTMSTVADCLTPWNKISLVSSSVPNHPVYFHTANFIFE